MLLLLSCVHIFRVEYADGGTLRKTIKNKVCVSGHVTGSANGIHSLCCTGLFLSVGSESINCKGLGIWNGESASQPIRV
jgi:hypothetical protein